MPAIVTLPKQQGSESQRVAKMKTIDCVKLARKANWNMLEAKRMGLVKTAEFCKELRGTYMKHAGIAWIAGR